MPSAGPMRAAIALAIAGCSAGDSGQDGSAEVADTLDDADPDTVEADVESEGELSERGNELATVATYGCLPEGDQLPFEIGPGENIVGTIVLDTANPTGTLVYKPWYVDGGGWEWNY